jgi:glutamate carboxypeptidase
VECRLRGGSGEGRLLMMGHIYTAFPVGSPKTNPFRIDGAKQRAYGPAVADMKGGDAGIVFACRALVETGIARPEQITVIFDTDEQGGSVRSRPLIEAEARNSDWGLVTEAGRVGGEVVGQRAGIAIGEIVIEGVEAHLGTGFRTGRSAIEAMCRKVIALHELHDPDSGVLLNVGEFNGGTRRNLYAGHCVARMDIRCVDHAAWDRTRKAIEAIAAADDVPGTRTTLKLWQHRPPMPWTPETRRMAELVREAGAAMGANIDAIATMGASDANIIAAQGVPTLCGLGPVGGAIMTREEYIELPTLVERAALVAALAHKLGTGAL